MIKIPVVHSVIPACSEGSHTYFLKLWNASEHWQGKSCRKVLSYIIPKELFINRQRGKKPTEPVTIAFTPLFLFFFLLLFNYSCMPFLPKFSSIFKGIILSPVRNFLLINYRILLNDTWTESTVLIPLVFVYFILYHMNISCEKWLKNVLKIRVLNRINFAFS